MVSGADGKSIFNGKEATAFSDAEEAAIGTVNVSCAFQSRRVFFNGQQTLPFSIEERIRLLGADYKKADNLWEVRTVPAGFCSTDISAYPQPKVVCSGKLITGQNPASARPLAKEILKTLKSSSA
jgi:putative intracellular protease/amidase